MKKIPIICVIIAFVMVLAACGGPAAPGGSGKENGDAKQPDTTSHSKDDLGRIFSATIEETVLVDEQGVKITANDLSYTDYSAELQLTLENNSDRDLSFHSETLGYSWNSVNGYMMPVGFISEDVAAGMNAATTISLSFDELSMYGITDIADIGLGFEIDDGTENYLKTGPLELKTSAADSYDYSKDTFVEAMESPILPAVYGFSVDYKGTEKLLEDYGLTIEKEYVITNKGGEKDLFMEVVNNSEQNLYIAAEDVCVNGMNVNSGTWESESIAAGKRALLTLEFDRLLSKSYLELLGMKKYTDCSMTLNVLDESLKTVGSKEVSVAFDGTSLPDSFAGEKVYDSNGYTFQTVGLSEDPSDYSNDVHVLCLMKNTSGQEVTVGTMFNDVYVNKTKVMDITYGCTAKDGGYALIDITLSGLDLEANSLDISKITEVATKFNVSDGDYTTYDEPEVTMTF